MRATTAAAGLLLAASLAPGAAAAEYVEGTHYTRLERPLQVEAPPGKVEVREFFWYGCSHCFNLEPQLAAWRKPRDAFFVRTPAVLGERWLPHAHAYYALEALGRLKRLHDVFFEALHVRRLRLNTRETIADFFAGHGVERERFLAAYDSFAVNTKVNKARRLGRQYGISGVPTLAVGGRYVINNRAMSSYRDMFDLVDYLVERAAPTARRGDSS